MRSQDVQVTYGVRSQAVLTANKFENTLRKIVVKRVFPGIGYVIHHTALTAVVIDSQSSVTISPAGVIKYGASAEWSNQLITHIFE